MPSSNWLFPGAIFLMIALICGCGKSPNLPDTPASHSHNPDNIVASGGVSQFFARNLVYRFDEDIVTEMPALDADIRMIKSGDPFVPGNADDFVVDIHRCDLGIDKASLEAIFNKYVFNFEGSPLSNLSFTFLDNRVKLAGKMKKGFLSIAFEAEGPILPNGSGQVVLRPDTIRANGVKVTSLMGLMGMDIATFINMRKESGVRIDGNDVVIYPNRLLPPPAIRGFVQTVTVNKRLMVLGFNDRVVRPVPTLPDPAARNWLLFYGGDVMLANTLMKDAKVQMVDMAPQDPMYYFMPLYKEQMVAGTMRYTMKGETISYVPDIKGTHFNPPAQAQSKVLR
ncbi:MAG TPA: hypothetical protein DD435_03555 [Cyanobacteria bacterium UBA8530]|nr:hypothetical protein [Cyanobacteria bacterium UBA8530]